MVPVSFIMCIVWADDVYLDLAIYSCLNKQIRVFWLVSSLSPIQFSSWGSSAEEVNFSSQHDKHAIIMLEEFFFYVRTFYFPVWWLLFPIQCFVQVFLFPTTPSCYRGFFYLLILPFPPTFNKRNTHLF